MLPVLLLCKILPTMEFCDKSEKRIRLVKGVLVTLAVGSFESVAPVVCQTSKHSGQVEYAFRASH